MPPLDELARAAAERQRYWESLSQYGYPLFLGCFAIGALLLLLYVCLPRAQAAPVLLGSVGARLWNMLAARRVLLGQLGLAILMVLCAISQQQCIDRQRGFIADRNKQYEKHIKSLARQGKTASEIERSEYLYIPQGNSLACMTLGNTSLAADYIWLTSLQYVSNSFRRGHKYDLLAPMYETMLELDPHWVEALVNAGKILSALEDDREKVEGFFRKAFLKNGDDYRLFFEAGRLYIMPPPPGQRARLQAVYLRKSVTFLKLALFRLKAARQTPQSAAAINEIEGLMALLQLESGGYDAAASMLYKRASDTNNPAAMRVPAARDWLNAQSMVIVTRLQRAVDAFKQQRGAYPPDLRALFAVAPQAAQWQRDAYEKDILYDAQTGQVSSLGVRAVHAFQAYCILAGYLDHYKADKKRPPANLRVLQQWIKEYYSVGEPPPGLVLDFLGADFECENGPLGPWDYNPSTGTIKLPDVCNMERLYAPARKLTPDLP